MRADLTAPAKRSNLCSMSKRAREDADPTAAGEPSQSTSEFIRDPIRRAQRVRDKERLARRLVQSLDSGVGVRVDASFWKRKRRELENRRGDQRRKPR